ncbi:MAG: FAD-binding oxidoreductase [Armatimonadetes bacterium]|nr:FAD-binding oxidoreductase [Armatimonadota bacterium]
MNASRFAVLGQTPADIAAPSTVAEAQEVVRGAQGRSIVPWGGGTRQHVGYPPERYDLAVSTENLDAVTDYHPADLTVTAQAGVTVARLQATLAERGQWLPLDVAAPERQTVGGLVAARADSLRRLACGSVRDSLIGVTVVNHAGELVKGGGRVVKNVSGYDLPKLYCGSWGTLGLIVDATFKVAPLPEASATAALPLPAGRNSEDALDRLLASELEPSFLFLLNPSAAHAILSDAEDAQYLVLGFDGSTEAVAWQLETLGAPALETDGAAAARARLRDFALADAPMTASFHILSSQVGAFARMMEWTARRAGLAASVAADAALGMLRAHFFPGENADWAAFAADFQDKALRVGGSCIIERMPDALRALDIPIWSPLLPDFDLMARLKEKLDPRRMWNPGRFVGRL